MEGSWISDEVGYDTKLVHGGVVPDVVTGSILTPISQCTTFVQESIDLYLNKGYSYSRTSNPTVKVPPYILPSFPSISLLLFHSFLTS